MLSELLHGSCYIRRDSALGKLFCPLPCATQGRKVTLWVGSMGCRLAFVWLPLHALSRMKQFLAVWFLWVPFVSLPIQYSRIMYFVFHTLSQNYWWQTWSVLATQAPCQPHHRPSHTLCLQPSLFYGYSPSLYN